MRIRAAWLAVAMMLVAQVAVAQDLSGMWELQAIGQDGTAIQVEHSADSIVLYRVMYPEFEGEKYKLEHIYKGRIIGKKMSGTLLVRDDPKIPFESLRSFDGAVQSDTYMVVDDLPLKLVKAGKEPLPVQLPGNKKKGKRGNTPVTGSTSDGDGQAIVADHELLGNILGGGGSLLEVSARIRLPSPADDYEKAAVAAEKAGKTEAAIDYYNKALAVDGKRLELYPRLGALLLKAKRAPEAAQVFKQALRFDPHNKTLRAQLKKAAATTVKG